MCLINPDIVDCIGTVFSILRHSRFIGCISIISDIFYVQWMRKNYIMFDRKILMYFKFFDTENAVLYSHLSPLVIWQYCYQCPVVIGWLSGTYGGSTPSVNYGKSENFVFWTSCGDHLEFQFFTTKSLHKQ